MDLLEHTLSGHQADNKRLLMMFRFCGIVCALPAASGSGQRDQNDHAGESRSVMQKTWKERKRGFALGRCAPRIAPARYLRWSGKYQDQAVVI